MQKNIFKNTKMKGKSNYIPNADFHRVAGEICEKEGGAENIISQVTTTRDAILQKVENPYENYSLQALNEAIISVSRNEFTGPTERQQHLRWIYEIKKKREKK